MTQIDSPILLKIGGSIAEDEQALHGIVAAVVKCRAGGLPLVLVHGGGKAISRNLSLLNEVPRFIEGLRVTTPAAMDMVEMTLSGQVNKQLVRLINCQAQGFRAVGLSGVDANTLTCQPVSAELGRVGKITSVNGGYIVDLLQLGYMVVVSPISISSNFESYNVNADEAAGALGAALKVQRLLFLSDVPGVLDGSGAKMSSIPSSIVESLIKSEVVKGGMIPKLRACVRVLAQGVQEVHICGWQGEGDLVSQLTGMQNHGTIISKG